MDTKDFNKLGVGIDDLIDGFIQTVMCSAAIDDVCSRLAPEDSTSFDLDLFSSMNKDEALIAELMLSPTQHGRPSAKE